MICDGNAGKSGRTNNCLLNSAGRRRRLALALAAAGAIAPCGHAFAQYAVSTVPLWTTEDDFTGWTAEGVATSVTPVPSSTYDLDGSTTNGVGNIANAGATGTAGGLEINTGSNVLTTYGGVAEAPGNALSSQTFMNAFDPGGTAPNTVSYSGTMYLTYSNPQFAGAACYFQFGIQMNYAGNDGTNEYYGPILFPSSTTSTHC